MLARFTKAPPAAPADTLACVRPEALSTTANLSLATRASCSFGVTSAFSRCAVSRSSVSPAS